MPNIRKIRIGAARPTGFTATAGDGRVTLSWDNPGNPEIKRYQYIVNSGRWIDIPNSDASTTSYTVTGLTNGTQYTFEIRAVVDVDDPFALTTQSEDVTATPAAAALAKPTGFSAAAGNAQVTLSWTDLGNSAITKYQYQQQAGGGSYGSWTDISAAATTRSPTR